MESHHDIAELQRENESLRREIAKLQGLRALTYRDGLTGLWNRRYFAERLGAEFSRARRSASRPFTLMVLNINDFHRINTSHGPQEGDLVLRWLAEFLEKSVRAHDVCCRIGADEFAIIVPDMNRTAAPCLLQRLRDKLSALSDRAPFSFGLSLGAASYPEEGATFDALVRTAEEARLSDRARQGKAAPATQRAPQPPNPAPGSSEYATEKAPLPRRTRQS